jgi:DNA topoisomerase-1
LFQYYDDDGKRHSIGSADVNNYLKQITDEDFTAKDFRCWAGSVNALHEFQEAEQPQTQTEAKRKVVEVLDLVSSKLGNTRTVCKKYYVHPTVIAAYERGTIWDYKLDDKISALNPEEEALVHLLETEKIAEVIG